MNESKTSISRQVIEVDSLKTIAIYLEGVKQGRGGSLLPLGNNDLEQLWNTIAFLKGDERFTAINPQEKKDIQDNEKTRVWNFLNVDDERDAFRKTPSELYNFLF
jgi:hypothetical protein